jgi:hypothetical protein
MLPKTLLKLSEQKSAKKIKRAQECKACFGLDLAILFSCKQSGLNLRMVLPTSK